MDVVTSDHVPKVGNFSFLYCWNYVKPYLSIPLLFSSFYFAKKVLNQTNGSGVSRVGLRGGFQKSELVSGGVSKSHKLKWLVKVCASKGVTRLI